MNTTAQASGKPKPKTRPLHVSLELHKAVSKVALDRDMNKKDAAAEVVRLGLAAIRSSSPR